MATLITNHVDEVTPVYRECRDGKGALIQAVDAREKMEAERVLRANRAMTRQADGK